MSSFLSSNPKELASVLNTQKRQIEEEQTKKLASVHRLPYLNLQSFPLDLNSLSLITKEEAVGAESIPFFKEGKSLKIATANPKNKFFLEIKNRLQDKYQISIYFISLSSLKGTLQFYDKVSIPTSKFQETIQISKTQIYSNRLSQIEPDKMNVSSVLEVLFGSAVEQNSSDIHIEPEDHLIKIRFRVDGVLHDAVKLPKTLQQSVVSRLKLLAKLKLNISNEAQDGRITLLRDDESIDVRVSVLPSSFGEALVLRLLGIGALGLNIEQLGLQGVALKIIEAQLHKPNGMIITTGPTGSGKTTTLYSFLKELNKPGVKIITLEDPVEYKVEGIQQTPIDHRVDFSFVKALRSVLRQDPDVVMVGEIRDPETAETALQAALTGHVVLSTLHTNDASGAVPRLLTMGIKPFIIAPAMNAIIAQRLVRRLCQKCIKEQTLEQSLLERVTHILSEVPANSGVVVPKKFTFFSANGCDGCGGLGYKGRMGIYEVIEMTDPMRELVLAEPSGLAIKQLAIKQGSLSMLQDGLLKALNKVTDVAEVLRVAG